MKKNWFRKLIAATLCTIMLVQIPIQAGAVTPAATQEEETILPPPAEESDGEDTAYILFEEESQREDSVKHFHMSDGSFTAAQYEYPIHYEDEFGVLQDYDNTMTLTNDILEPEEEPSSSWTQAPAEASLEEALPQFQADGAGSGETQDIALQTRAPEEEYKNTASDLDIRLAKKAHQKKTVTIEKDGYRVSWGFTGVSRSDAVITPQGAPGEGDDRFLVLNNLVEETWYHSVYPAVDLQYLVTPVGVKENIVLQDKSAQNEFEMQFKLKNLTPAAQDDQTILLNNSEGQTIYYVNAPVMTDASGTASEGVTLSIVSVQNNKMTVKLTADRNWLDEGSRTYPVKIDPSFVTEQDRGIIQNAYIQSGNPSRVMGTGYGLYAGVNQTADEYGNQGKLRSFLRLSSLPSLPSGSKLVNAQLYLLVWECPADMRVQAHEVTSSWSPSTLCWNNAASYDNTILDYRYSQSVSSPANGVTHGFDLTSVARKWYDGQPNYGIMLMSPDETSSSDRCVDYASEGNDQSAARPIFQITYRDQKGIEDIWSFTGVEAGRSGSALVNNFNGNLVATQPITSADGNLMPVAINLVYGKSVGHALGIFGPGWISNYNIRVQWSPNEKIKSKCYKVYLDDADGTRHYFYFKDYTEGMSDEALFALTGKDEDGLGYTLSFQPSNMEEFFVITDKEGNRMTFRHDYGSISKIRDTNGNQVSMTYVDINSNQKERLKTVTDGTGRVYTYHYNSSGLVTSITDPAGRSTSLSYDSKDQLSTITYPDGKTTTYVYSESTGNLLRINNIDGTRVQVTYDASTPQKVSNIKTGGGGSELASYTFDYRLNETDITDKTGRTVTYQFNHYGQTTGVVNNVSGQAQYYQFGATGLKTVANVTDINEESNKIKSASKTLQSVVNHIRDVDLSDFANQFWTARYSSSNGTVALDSSHGYLDSRSIKVERPAAGVAGEYLYAAQDHQNLAAGTYTFSAYVNTNNTKLVGSGAIVRLETWKDGQMHRASYSPSITKTGYTEWIRVSTTLQVDAGDTLRVLVGYLSGDTVGAAWFDNLQLESGQAVNSVNLIENTDFHRVLWGWATNGPAGSCVDISGVPGADKAIQFAGSPPYARVVWSAIHIDGHSNDVFSAGAWVQANSVPVNKTNRLTGESTDSVLSGNVPSFCLSVEFFKNGTEVGHRIIPLNSHTSAWQYASAQVTATAAYDEVRFVLRYDFNANTVRMTLPYLYRENFGQSYTYDKDGNVVSTVDLANTQASFAYKNNQLSKLLNPTGSRYLYTYDGTTKNLTYAHSSDGQRYSFTYDSHGNPTSSKIVSSKPATQLESGKMYYVLNAYSGNALDSGGTAAWATAHNQEYSSGSQKQLWRVEATGTADVYQLKRYNTENNLAAYYAYTGDNVDMILAPAGDGQKFKITRNSDGTFTMFTGATNYSKCVDGQPGTATDTANGTPIKQYTYQSGDEGQKWYFFPYSESTESEGYMQSTAAYTADGNYMASVTDTRGSTSSYSYNTSKGLLTSETNPNGTSTSYTYDANNDSLTSVQSGGSTVSYTYDKDRLSAIYHNGGAVKYSFVYDTWGRLTSTRAGNGSAYATLMQNTYNDRNLVTQSRYGNNQYVYFTYDDLDRLTEKKYSEDEKFTYLYNANGALAVQTDSVNATATRYTYDMAGRVVNAREEQPDGTLRGQMYYRYENGKNRLSYYTFTVPKNGSSTELRDNTTLFTYGNLSQGQMPDAVYGVTAGVQRLAYTYDGLGRLATRTLSVPQRTTSYTYVPGAAANQTSALLQSINNAGEVLSYTYDANGNITEIKKGGVLQESYVYDSLNQLVRENSVPQNRTFTYTYDAGGNLQQKKEYAYTTGDLGTVLDTIVYTYGSSTWKDILTGYDGQVFTKDNLANPLTYRDGMSFTWQHGRQLATATVNGVTASYLYNDNGIRTQKTVGGVTTKYYLSGDQLHGELRNGKDIIYRYDANGQCYGFQYDGSFFYFEFNGQGDVIRLLNYDGSVRANYAYDAWGKILSVTDANGNEITDPNHMGRINPIRYRGYYYDEETGLYYLQSRYYDPVTGRFLNADSQLNAKDGILGYNMFAYCNNNPVMYSDPSGHSIILACIIVGAVVGALAGGHIAAKVSKAKTGKVNGWAVAGGIVGGGVIGGLAGWGVGAAITAIGAAAAGTAGTAAAPIVEKAAEKASTALQTYYPPNNGFSGAVERISLDVGTIIQRTGDFAGRFTAPAGTPSQMLSLPYDKIDQATTYLQTTQPVQALSGTVAPWFGQIGGGTQYLLLDGRVDQLLADGVLKLFGE